MRRATLIGAVVLTMLVLVLGAALVGRRLALPLAGPAAVAACTAPTALDCAFQGDAGIQQILTADLGQPLNQAQTIAGWTVTLRRVYADRNRLVVAYTVDGLDASRLILNSDPPQAEVADQALVAQGRWGGRKAGALAAVVWFDATALGDPPPRLVARFTVPALQVAAPALPPESPPTALAGAPWPTATIVPDDADPRPGPTAPAGPGPFRFDLGIPFDARSRVAALDLAAPAMTVTPLPTATAPPVADQAAAFPTAPPVPTNTPAGPAPEQFTGPARLRRVVVTASETRLYLDSAPLVGDGCQAELQAGAWDSAHNSGECNCRMLPDGQTVCGFGAGLLETGNNWTFTLAGRWTFHFMVP
jgi:hypothetical protein